MNGTGTGALPPRAALIMHLSREAAAGAIAKHGTIPLELVHRLLDERDHLNDQVTDLQALLSATRYGRLARKEGVLLAANPHDGATARGLYERWEDGWRSVDYAFKGVGKPPAAARPPAGMLGEPTTIERARTLGEATMLAVALGVEGANAGDAQRYQDAWDKLHAWCDAHVVAEASRAEALRQLVERIRLATGMEPETEAALAMPAPLLNPLGGSPPALAGAPSGFTLAATARSGCVACGERDPARRNGRCTNGRASTHDWRDASHFSDPAAPHAPVAPIPNPLFGPPPAAPTWTPLPPAPAEGSVEIAVLVRDPDGRTLLGLRRRPAGGTWAPPAGPLLAGEEPAQAAARILKDQTGLEVAGGAEVFRPLPWAVFGADGSAPAVVLWVAVNVSYPPHALTRCTFAEPWPVERWTWAVAGSRPTPLSSHLETLIASGADPFQPEGLTKLVDALLAQKHTIDSMVRDFSGVIPFVRSSFPHDIKPGDQPAMFLLRLLRELLVWRGRAETSDPDVFFARQAELPPEMRSVVAAADHVDVREGPPGTFTLRPVASSTRVVQIIGTVLSEGLSLHTEGLPRLSQAEWIALFRKGCAARGWPDPISALTHRG